MTRNTPSASAGSSIREGLLRLAGAVNDGLGCVVHVGAGSSVLADYADIAVGNLVAIEGDPDAAADLRGEVGQQAALPVTVVSRPVAVRSGAMLWHRYNLRSLNGPLDASPLSRYFPRLSLTSSLPTQAIGLGDCLADLELTANPKRPNLLVLDVPGQEDALLAGLEPSTLGAFDWVIVRGCAHPPGGASAAASACLARLETLQFVRENIKHNDGGLWPVTLLRFDRAGHERKALTDQLSEARARAMAFEQRIQELTHAKAASDKVAAERAAHFENLTKARDQQSALAAERLEQIQELAQAKAAADKIAGERAAHFEKLIKARDEQSGLAAERLKRVNELEKRVHQLEGELADSAVRQQLLQDELIKAEGQIDLIKDLLLRDHAL